MTGLTRSITRKARKITPKELPEEPITKDVGNAVLKTRFGPKIPKPAPVAPLPDEELLEQSRRRKRSRRLGARVNTVLSGGDEETVG